MGLPFPDDGLPKPTVLRFVRSISVAIDQASRTSQVRVLMHSRYAWPT